jgi:hypothetical protein
MIYCAQSPENLLGSDAGMFDVEIPIVRNPGSMVQELTNRHVSNRIL